MPFPSSKDPQTLLSCVKDWLEDAEQRLEDNRTDQAKESLQEAILLYSSLPPGNCCKDLELSLVKMSEKVYNNVSGKTPLK